MKEGRNAYRILIKDYGNNNMQTGKAAVGRQMYSGM